MHLCRNVCYCWSLNRAENLARNHSYDNVVKCSTNCRKRSFFTGFCPVLSKTKYAYDQFMFVRPNFNFKVFIVYKIKEGYLFFNVRRSCDPNVGFFIQRIRFQPHYKNHDSRDIIFSKVWIFGFSTFKK